MTMEFQEKFSESPNEKAELRKEYLEKFIDFRDNYIDDLPPEKVEHDDKNYHFYKCRKNFFQSVIADVENMIDEEMIDKQTINKYRRFFNRLQKIDFSGKNLQEGAKFPNFTTKKDIDEVNEIINCIIESLQDES